jgi:hypothetical protein
LSAWQMQSAGLIEAQLAPRAPSPIDCALAEACGRPRMGRFRGQAPSAAQRPRSRAGLKSRAHACRAHLELDPRLRPTTLSPASKPCAIPPIAIPQARLSRPGRRMPQNSHPRPPVRNRMLLIATSRSCSPSRASTSAPGAFWHSAVQIDLGC